MTTRWAMALVLVAVAGCGGSDIPTEDGGPDAGDDAPLATDVVALAGPDLTVLEGSFVQLDAHATRSLTANEAVLSWSQLDGPAVLLTNPAGPSPAFIAPLGPTSLTFRLRATANFESSTDDVTVRVLETPGSLPVMAEVPGDVIAAPEQSLTFTVGQQGDLLADVTWTARALCDGNVALSTEGDTIAVVLPETLPCAVRVDGVTADGRRAAPGLRVFWPEGTELPTTTRLMPSAFALGPSEAAEVAFDDPPTSHESARLWDAGGRALSFAGTVAAATTTLSAPSERTRLLFAGELRRGPASGGVGYLALDVTEGPGNRAPTVLAGPDRVVVPGGLFTLRPSASDVDGDEVTLSLEQVLGPTAVADEVTPGLYQAPEEEGVLLFHVRAFDGTVHSAPASVRVTVDEDVTNQPPTLDLESPRYVAPGQTFTLDARTAQDDSGYIERWTLAQEAEDPVVLVPAPIEVTARDDAAFTLTALGAGDVYHLRVSAFDAAGASTTTSVEVIVEEAGPWVDPARGDDATANGTVDAPFASLAAALPIAMRHRFEELYLTGGTHTAFGGELPPGLSLVGGFSWDGIAYGVTGVMAELPVAEEGLRLTGGGLERLRVTLTAPGATVVASGGCGQAGVTPCAFSDVELVATDVHESAVLVVEEDATLALVDTSVAAGDATATSQTVIDLLPHSQLRLENATVIGGAGSVRTALRCEDASLDVINSVVRASTGAEVGIGLLGDACDVQIVGGQLSGGAATVEAWGLKLADGSVRVESDAVIVGLDEGAADSATALELSGADGPAEVLGTLLATSGASATALSARGALLRRPRAELDGATVAATGIESALGVLVAGEETLLRDLTLDVVAGADGEAVGLSIAVADGAALHGGQLTVTGAVARGLALDGAPVATLELNDVFANVVGLQQASGLALGASTGIVIRDSLWEVSAGGSEVPTRGATVGGALIEDSTIRVGAPGSVLGVVVAQSDAGASLVRSTITADSTAEDATAVRAAAPTSLSSVLLRANGVTGGVGFEARSASTLRHATVIATGYGVDIASTAATLDAANALFIAPTGIFSSHGTAPLLQTVACAFDGDAAFDDGETQVTGGAELINLPCPACFITDTSSSLDENARLLPNATNLIDRGIAAYADATDIDGDPRPAGNAPDVGCDEYVEPAGN